MSSKAAILNKIKQNKKLRNIIIIGIAIILVIVIGLIILLFPYIVKLFNFIAEKGVSGLVELSKEIIMCLKRGPLYEGSSMIK